MSKLSARPHHRSKVGPMARRFDSKATYLAQAVYLSLGTPLALDLLGKSLNGDFRDVVERRIDPTDYSSAETFRLDYLACSLMSKFPEWDLGIDRDRVSLASFLEAEQACAATAKRLSQRYVNGVYSRITPESILHSARGKIARLLGPFSWDEAESYFTFGPGATFSRPRREGDSYYKYRAKPCTTFGCAMLSYTAIRRIPRWFEHVVSLTGRSLNDFESLSIDKKIEELFEIVPGNRVTFVPKDASKNRTIAIEPTMNGFIQHGIGSLLRRRLRRARVNGPHSPRIDLNDQSRNQHLAYLSSLDGKLATVDLASASDSISMRLVEELFPPDWVDAFRLTRSPRGILPDGSVVNYHKVSSMGNGYTFELESMIFWAITRAVVDLLGLKERRVSVYGDDIICPVDCIPTLEFVLKHCGFTFNASKSYSRGWFRESCGKHYFRGRDVTPFYVRKDLDTNPRIIWFCNQIRRWSTSSIWGLDDDLLPAYEMAVALLPRLLQKPSIPDGVGDFALIGDLDEVSPTRLFHGLDGWKFNAWIPVFKTREFCDVPFLLRQLSAGSSQKGISLRQTDALALVPGLPPWLRKNVEFLDDSYRVKDSRSEPRWRYVKHIPVTNWPSYGPWLTTGD